MSSHQNLSFWHKTLILVPVSIVLTLLVSNFIKKSYAKENKPLNKTPETALRQKLPELSSQWPNVDTFMRPYSLPDRLRSNHTTTIDPRLQKHLKLFLEGRSNPISAVVVAKVDTGEILAMVGGRDPAEWNSNHHPALHSLFPAASLFKTVVATAAIEVGGLAPKDLMVLWGGCSKVRRNGIWLREEDRGSRHRISLAKAYGRSCNGLFAKLAVSYLGLNTINTYADRFGWGQQPETDFNLPASPITPPNATKTSVHTVGRFAAGFGDVGTSAVHMAWTMLSIANDGKRIPIKLFENSKLKPPNADQKMMEPETAATLRKMMKATTVGGTANYAFRQRKYRRMRHKIGGKTGTLSGETPKGITTWFAGMMPLDRPEIVVAAVVVLDGNLWHIKGPNLAAEAFWAFKELKNNKSRLVAKYGSLPWQNPSSTRTN